MESISESRLVVIGASVNIARVAREIGCRTVFVQQPGSPVEKLVDTRSNLYSVDFTDGRFIDFVDFVLRPLRPDAVVSVTERGLLPAAIAAEHLGLPGVPPAVVSRLRDKTLMRAHMQEKLPSATVRFAEPASGVEAAAIMRSWDCDVIVKPKDGTGSTEIRHFTRPEDLEGVGCLASVIMEEYIDGPEYSAESFSIDGKHALLAVVEKHATDNFVELGHVVPAGTLGPGDAAKIEVAISEFLRAMGLTDGPAHTEFRISAGKVKIIESHNRVAGGSIPDLVHAVTGVNLKRWSLGWPLGLREADCRSQPTAAAAAAAFATAQPGRVVSVDAPSVPAKAEGNVHESVTVFVTPGDTVRELSCSRERVGCATATGATPETAKARADELARKITVTTREN
ncbi:ATP-grasp domain-containing protein [Streptomyces sp. NPDC091972]|uniref:ATP-grasp domain-containing protein n=1 Tax=Streptomyces sp. NPDC091972 TaxID=3366007 RepID=UPI0037FD4749